MNSIESTNEQESHLLVELFWETIPQTWSRVRHHIRRTVGENFDITFEQYHVLRNVNRGLASVSELAEAKQTSRSAMSQAVDGLVDRGFLTRRQNPDDRRYVQLILTEQGQRVLDRLLAANREWILSKVEKLSHEEMLLIMDGLRALKSAFLDQESSTRAGG